MSLLKTHQLKVAYGGIKAVRGVDMEIAAGELVCLIGANGAGKSSFLKGLMGLVRHAGEVRLNDTRLTGLPSHAIARQGICLVPEGRGIFARLTVAENLEMGAFARSDRASMVGDMSRMYELFPRLAERKKQLAGTLSGGEQQLLAIARALVARPRLLLLDEPSMGLAPLMVRKVYETILDISRQGVTILLVEQNAHIALQVSQRGYVMEGGGIVLQGDSSELLSNPRVREAYLGAEPPSASQDQAVAP